jgi:hypothetical protein
MEVNDSFHLFDCSVVRYGTGRVCFNLRELGEAVRTVTDPVLEYHMMRCPLDDHFELHEFPNDFALWSWASLGDHALGEQLGLVDPYKLPSFAALRTALTNVIEDHLWTLQHVPWSRSGVELHLIESRLIASDTGERLSTPAALVEAIERMSLRSLYFHVHDARRRTGGASDDFSLWLEQRGADAALVARLRAIDFYMLNLGQLRIALLDAFRQHGMAVAAQR